VHRKKLEAMLYNVKGPERFGDFEAYTHMWIAENASARIAPVSLERGMLVASKGLHGDWVGPKPSSLRCYNEYGSNYPVASSDLGCGTLVRIIKGTKAMGSDHEQAVVFGLIYEEVAASGEFAFALRTLSKIQPFLSDSSLSTDWTTCAWTPVVMNLALGFDLGWGLGDFPFNESSRWTAPCILANSLESNGGGGLTTEVDAAAAAVTVFGSTNPRVAKAAWMAAVSASLAINLASFDASGDRRVLTRMSQEAHVWELSEDNHGSEWGVWDCAVYADTDAMSRVERRLS
jgi:hypothetical protein